MDEIKPHWYQLAGRQGKGASIRPGSLGGLAEARRANRGEFFTPDAVAKRMFEIVAPAMRAASPWSIKTSTTTSKSEFGDRHGKPRPFA